MYFEAYFGHVGLTSCLILHLTNTIAAYQDDSLDLRVSKAPNAYGWRITSNIEQDVAVADRRMLEVQTGDLNHLDDMSMEQHHFTTIEDFLQPAVSNRIGRCWHCQHASLLRGDLTTM